MRLGLGVLGQSRFWRRVLRAAIGLTVVAALGGSAVFGWWLHDRLAKPQPAVVKVDRPIRVVEQSQSALGTVPNVLGLDEQTAQQVFVDGGIDPGRLTTTNEPYAGQAGVVISQDPPAGSPVGTGKLALTLSATAKMPTLVGNALADARTTLAALGASVLVSSRYQPNTPENTVLETDPKAGDALTERATLIVAEPPSSVFLSELRAINSSCGTQTLNVGGIARQNALECQPGQGSPATLDYLLNKRVATFAAVLGLGDRGGTDTPVTFTVSVDGKRRFGVTLRFGQVRSVNIPVVGSLRIHIAVSIGKPGASGQQPQAVIANARFLGGRKAIDNLVAESKQ